MIDFTGTKIEDGLLEINIHIDENEVAEKIESGFQLKYIKLYTPEGWTINNPLLILSDATTVGATSIDLTDIDGYSYSSSFAYYDLRDATNPTKSIDLKAIPIIVEVGFDGIYKEDVQCALLKNKGSVLVYDKKVIYTNGIGYLRSMNGCTPDRNFIDYILNLKALSLASNSCNYIEASKIWDRLVGNNNTKLTSNCGCHG